MTRRGSAESNTTADHLQVLGDAIAALPPKFRRLGTGSPRARRHRAGPAAGLADRHRVARRGARAPRRWRLRGPVLRTWTVLEEAHVTELTGLLNEARDGWRYTLWVSNMPAWLRGWQAQLGYIDAAHRVHVRVEGCIRTEKDCGIGRFPSHDFRDELRVAGISLIAAALLSWLRLMALDGELTKAEPKLCVTGPACRRQAGSAAAADG
jgi:hypothetical protein